MANFREALAATHHASLEWHEREAAVDRVAASGKADRLGVCLWKAKYMQEVWAYLECRRELRKRFLVRYKYENWGIAGKLVEQALTEFIACFCPDCLGKKEQLYENLRVICRGCAGSGIRLYSDIDRSKMTKLSLQRCRSLENKFDWIQRLISEEEGRVNYVLNVELERAGAT